MMSSGFHREEGLEGEEEPVNPQPPVRERERSHGKTKKGRRERRHADHGEEATASATPPATSESQTQVKTGVANYRSHRIARIRCS